MKRWNLFHSWGDNPSMKGNTKVGFPWPRRQWAFGFDIDDLLAMRGIQKKKPSGDIVIDYPTITLKTYIPQ